MIAPFVRFLTEIKVSGLPFCLLFFPFFFSYFFFFPLISSTTRSRGSHRLPRRHRISRRHSLSYRRRLSPSLSLLLPLRPSDRVDDDRLRQCGIICSIVRERGRRASRRCASRGESCDFTRNVYRSTITPIGWYLANWISRRTTFLALVEACWSTLCALCARRFVFRCSVACANLFLMIVKLFNPSFNRLNNDWFCWHIITVNCMYFAKVQPFDDVCPDLHQLILNI